ncbi:MAG: peptidylprolyl isomerase [Deltaproteobacteria bacterium]|nr:peptidylprolyl isomerase [Deltaproteobacteria bacterium]
MRAFLFTLLVVGCSERGAPTEGAPAPPEKAAEPAPAPQPAETPDDEACAAQIVVQYAGAAKAGPDSRRTKEEARARAVELIGRLRGGATFEDLARAESDHPSKARGGLIGTFRRDQIPPEIASAVFALTVGQTSAEPTETPGGFHLFQRLPVEKVRARHILVRYRGARNDRGASRDRDEARRLAEEVRGLATKAGADFAALAREKSEDGSAARGGDLGEFGRGAMVPAFDAAVFPLAPNEVSEVVETEFGFHVIQRLP